MKTHLLAAALLLMAADRTLADFITNGSFEDPSVHGTFGLIPNGQVPGWTGINNQGGMEIDDTSILSPAGTPAYDGVQSTEVDDTFGSITQTVVGLTVGQQYVLSWAYGLRPSAGRQALDVFFGDDLVAHNGGTADPNALIWEFNSYTVTATSTSEVLRFTSVSTQLTGAGNEIDAVSLVGASVPEPSSALAIASGLVVLAFRRGRSGGNPGHDA